MPEPGTPTQFRNETERTEGILEDIYRKKIIYKDNGCTGQTNEKNVITEEQLSEWIILNKNLEKKDKTDEFIQMQLKYGSKILKVSLHFKHHYIETYVENCPDTKSEPDQTTHLYRVAKRIMQELVNQYGLEMHYVLQTSFTTMQNWASTKGAEIFGWDSTPDNTEEHKDGSKKVWYVLPIKPEHK
ncbi:MAG TPA: hypothetical protein DEB09_02140 [Candidatus Magasanikbacteria bacterium]|nr:hypothetical protein [Candidatus Magasanikbacteria bacterium]